MSFCPFFYLLFIIISHHCFHLSSPLTLICTHFIGCHYFRQHASGYLGVYHWSAENAAGKVPLFGARPTFQVNELLGSFCNEYLRKLSMRSYDSLMSLSGVSVTYLSYVWFALRVYCVDKLSSSILSLLLCSKESFSLLNLCLSSHREFMSSYLVFDHKTNYCAMNKLFPAERFQTFNIWHCTYKQYESFVFLHLILKMHLKHCVSLTCMAHFSSSKKNSSGTLITYNS